MLSKTLTFSQNLIAIKTDPDNRAALNEALDLVASELTDFTVELFERNGARSLLAYAGKTRPEKFTVILNGHLDVIPGKDWQYEARIDGDKMYGVGSMDMKSNVDCMVEVFKDIATKLDYPLGLQIVTDEEIGGFDGNKLQIEEGVKADFVIAGETTQFNIVHQARGILQLKVTANGKTAHGAYPWRGENALEKLNTFLALLSEKMPNPSVEEWKSSINLAKIETPNNNFNKIPDVATAWLDVRFIPQDADTILPDIKSLLPVDFELEITANEPYLFVKKDDEYLQKIQQSVKKVLNKESICYGAFGSSDARFYTQAGSKGVEFGPVGGGIGTDEEWVSIQSLQDFYDILETFLIDLS
jgi:succinyl-diaminopimelate desuccinylase